MNKGLQALKRLQGENRVGIYDVIDIAQDLETAEYYLQALEIIKNKKVNVHLLLDECCPDLETYNCYGFEPLTQEEYQHLKEVFGND